MSARTTIDATDVVVDDWRNIGDAYQSHDCDGFPIVCLPDSRPVVTVVTPFGRMYVSPLSFASADEAEVFAARVRSVGSVNEDRWTYVRGCYGTPAYEADGWLDYDRALD